MGFGSICRGRQLDDSLRRSRLGSTSGVLQSAARLRGCSTMSSICPWSCTAIVGVANLATRSFRNNGGRCMKSATATSPLASPGGKPRTQKPLVITIQRASQLRRFRVAKLATPTGRGGNYESTAANAVHPLRQPVRAASSPGGSQGVQTFSLYALLQLMWKIFYFLF